MYANNHKKKYSMAQQERIFSCMLKAYLQKGAGFPCHQQSSQNKTAISLRNDHAHRNLNKLQKLFKPPRESIYKMD
jgi:hypothetical protein